MVRAITNLNSYILLWIRALDPNTYNLRDSQVESYDGIFAFIFVLEAHDSGAFEKSKATQGSTTTHCGHSSCT